MRRSVSFLSFILVLVLAPAVFAQATRTWVSGVGDDANPCSRTAPCKTFAGAISKTAAGGEISVLDPGGFGAVNITKSMTINGYGQHSSILFSGTNGVIVNGAGITVNLNNISFNGGTSTSPGINGIRIIQAANVTVRDCDIFNYSANGILDERATAGSLAVIDSSIHDPIGSGTTAMGIKVQPVGAVNNLLTVVRTNIYNNRQTSSNAISLANGAKASIQDSMLNNNRRAILADNAGVDVTLVRSTVTNNTDGIQCRNGATCRLSDNSITRNTGSGVIIEAGSTVQGFENNALSGNGAGNGPLPAVPQQ